MKIWLLLLSVIVGTAAGVRVGLAFVEELPLVENGQFRVPEGFTVEEVYAPEASGSVVAMTFDSQGRLVFSRERGPVVVLTGLDEDGRAVGEMIFTDQVTNCHGLHFDGPDLLAVGEGPEGTGLYRVVDQTGDGRGDRVELITRSTDRIAEHGPHAVLFGPDGRLYWILGNHTFIVPTPHPLSPYRDYIEGHLLPIYTDPRGHATRIRAPGGTVVRIDLEREGADWEVVAGGFRNHYAAAFNQVGELFTFDSDMEWDLNLPWFRPVRTVHVVPGGEYGWRTGSGKWPDYFIDSLPPMTDVGRGSPVGVTFYQSYAYPSAYHDAFILGDWSRGRILAGFLEPDGATYRERLRDFVLGEPLNVTDLQVGPDGRLYFTRGGRMTEGGIYRVDYRGRDAPGRPGFDSPLEEALTQPQPRSAWSRSRLAEIRDQLGPAWEEGLRRVVLGNGSAPKRIRALELLQVNGPAPSEELLGRLLDDPHSEVRAAAVYYLGLHPTDSSRRMLTQRLRDPDPFVVRRACEALIRTGIHAALQIPLSPSGDLLPLLGHSDRWVRYAAREALKRTNRNRWREEALRLSEFPAASEALLALVQTARNTHDVPVLLDRQLELLEEDPSDQDLPGLLRVVHLTMIQDEGVDYSSIYGSMGEILLGRFPSGERFLDREIARTLARLQTPGAVEAILGALEASEGDRERQIHFAYCLRAFEVGWEEESRDRMVSWFQRTQRERWRGGASFLGFIENIWNDFLGGLTPEERQLAMEQVPSLSPQPAEDGEVVPAFRRATFVETVSNEELEEFLLWDPMAYSGDPRRGLEAYQKAYCSNCHIFGGIGQEAGPDLTDVGRRFQRRDLIEAILYPSRTLSDLWAAQQIETEDGQTVVGVISRQDADSITVTNAAGQRIQIPRSRIRSMSRSETSLMPEGLLNLLDQREMIDLFALLERGLPEDGETEQQ